MVINTFGKPPFKRGAIATLIISSFLLSGCGEKAVELVTAPVIQPALTEIVNTQQAADLSFNGVVRAAERADMAFRIGGRLTNIFVNEGDEVKKGQLLATLDSRDAKTALESAELELKNTTLEYERAQAIYKKSQAISKADLDAITTRFDLAKNRVAEAKRQLEYTELHAPFDGIVGRKMMDNHIQVQANEPVLTVHDLNDLEVVINIPHQVMLSGGNRTKAIAEISSIPGQAFPLTLRTFATQADSVSQTYAVVLGLEQVGFRVLPGMAVKVIPDVNAVGDENSLITLPLTAVVPDNQGKQFVWVVGDDNKAEKRYVGLGALVKDRIVVEQNLALGERVIIAGVSSVREGMEVRPYTDERTGA
ncbi:efflux RND transporter periplasmic adaptor subunit [Grimontia sp. NTOU-MAR1]|uniref:efflux RND transporter periplasmic adaptor subunit n=1 Tax=Grimontia sp. NTOU-MAR1 TaxID=3111011 RepID=UPI002DB98E83|nr:efflux RND transporter periplasmic adaptor subunit [Grimontia sp. NTOU-MAR1]WRV98053.1 efflux RND transporter periplasmic adaptor subunit [Grimontia sp. NTOU-MAR1]